MGIIRRFFLYFIGIGIGMIITFIFFGNRNISCSYFPNSRVLYDISKKKIVYDKYIYKNIITLNIDTSYINIMLKKGTVNFNKSNAKLDSCKTYQIEYKKYAIKVKNCDSITFIYDIWKNKQN